MKKITFYGKDFSRLDGAKYSLDDSSEKEVVDNERLKLLNTFCTSYNIVDLLFPKDNALFNKYVGVFRIQELKFEEETYDVTLEISCRFDQDDKAFFLSAMLLCLTNDELHFIKPEVNVSFHQVMDIFLLFMFKKQLAEAAEKGIFRKYQRFESNDGRPHGTIDIARHIRENMGLNNGRIAYNYRELTADNPVNRLILAACKRLREKFSPLCETYIDRDESVCSTLNMLQTELGYSKTDVRSIVKENLRPITHPYFLEYEDLRKTCLKILRDERVSIFDAEGSEETDAIYFNITELWEKYLEFQFIKLGLEKGSEFLPQKRVIFLTSLEQDGKGIDKEAKPDFLFQKGKQNIAILDAKFKPQWKERRNEFLTADIDECIRNLVVFWARRTGVIYPSDNSESKLEEFNIVDLEDHRRLFDVVEVAVPETKGKTFGAWREELDKNVSHILGRYLEKLDGL